MALIKGLYQNANFEEALAQVLLAKESIGDKPDFDFYHSGILFALGKSKEALLYLEKAMSEAPQRMKLLTEINKQAQKLERNIECLLQVHIATEETKFGLDEKELIETLEYYTAQLDKLQHVTIRGLMGMASFSEDEAQVRAEFRSLKALHHLAAQSFFLGDDRFNILSMGMSGDYKMAIEEGSTHVRVGSLLFGNRKP